MFELLPKVTGYDVDILVLFLAAKPQEDAAERLAPNAGLVLVKFAPIARLKENVFGR